MLPTKKALEAAKASAGNREYVTADQFCEVSITIIILIIYIKF